LKKSKAKWKKKYLLLSEGIHSDGKDEEEFSLEDTEK